MHCHAWPFSMGGRTLRSGIHTYTIVLATAQLPQRPEVSVLLHVFLETTALSFVEEIPSEPFLT